MKLKYVVYTLVVCFLFTGIVSAQDGLALLKVGHGARQSGMGEASVSIPNDVNGSMYNPASIKSFSKFTASFGHTEYWENIRFESGFFAASLSDKINILGGIRYAVDENLEERTQATEDPDAYFDYHDISFKTGLAYKQNDKLTFGFAFGWLFEKNNRWRGSVFNVDLGMHYQASDQLNLGASIINFGSDMKLNAPGGISSREIPIPTRYTAGASYRQGKYLGSVDFLSLDSDIKVHLGVESNIHRMFDLRAGYMINYGSKDFSAGASFTKRNIKVDYAFVPYSNNLGSSHLFNFTFSI